MTAIKERDPYRPPKYRGRPPRVDDDAILRELPATLRALAQYLKLDRSTLAYRLGCLELEGKVVRERHGHNVGDTWQRPE